MINYIQQIFYGTNYYDIVVVLLVGSLSVMLLDYLFDKFTESLFGKFISLTYRHVIDLSIKVLILIFVLKYFDNKLFPWI